MYVRQKAVPEAKIKRVRELAELFEKYDSVLVVNITGVPAPVLHEMRKKLREEGHVLKVVKNTLAKIAIDEVAEKKRGIERLKDRLVGQNALIFTSENVFSLKMFLDKNKIAREARAGDVAQSDVVVPAGNTNLAPGPVLSLFSKLKIPTNIKEGSIWVAKDTVVAKKGDVISSDLAELLRKLDVKPIEVGLEVKAAYADGVVLAAEALEIDLEEIREELLLQLVSPVRWTDSVRYMLSQGVDTFVEVGPRKVLAGLIRRTDKSARVISIESAPALESFVQLQASMQEEGA